MAENKDDKQEKPTAKRKKDALERGQVGRSRDLAAALGICLIAIGLIWAGADLLESVSAQLAHDLGELHTRARVGLDERGVGTLVVSRIWWFFGALAPVAALAVLSATAGHVMQGGGLFAPKALEWKWDRLLPSHGLKRLSPSQSGADLVKATLALIVVAAVTVPLVTGLIARVPEIVAMPIPRSAALAWDDVWRLIWRGGLALFVLGAVDFGYQRWNWLRGLRMSRREMTDESKLQDGNPEVRARVRRIQRDMTRRRMLADVKTATVVLTNPTHVAVALAYRRESMAAPVVVAKGSDALAARIRAEARAHQVPIIENPPLARALHAQANVGETIPSALFSAVAEVLAYLVRIRQLVL